MRIRKTTTSDLSDVMKIYEYARKFMAEHGNPDQWGTTWPPREQIEQDIREENSYVCEQEGKIRAVFYFVHGEDVEPTYVTIHEGSWIDDEKSYGVIHRFASNQTVKGAATNCINWAYEECGQNLRIDTHEDNYVMQNLLQKNGFTFCGIIDLVSGMPRRAYQKIEN